MPEVTETIEVEKIIEPKIPLKEDIETYFKTMPDGDPTRDRIFKVRYRTPFYANSDNEDTHSHKGNIIQKIGVDDKKRTTTEDDYYVLMEDAEFKSLFPQNEEVVVRNVQRAVKFRTIGVDPIYYKEPGKTKVKKLSVGDNLFVFLNPSWISRVNPHELPAYDSDVDTTGYGRSHK